MSIIVKKVQVPSNIASEFEDLHGVSRDLEMARELCLIARDLGNDDANQGIAVDGLLSAALIRYMRCFSSGVRSSLKSEDLEKLGAEIAEAHNFLKDFRDKHLAHSVNHYEDCYANVDLHINDGSLEKIYGLLPGSSRVILNNGNGFALLTLIDKMIWLVVEKKRAAEIAVVDKLNSLGDEVVLNFKPRQPKEINPSEIRTSRKKSSK
ncbi:HEPN_AbiU2 domain-containing protein [Pseudomonas sp. IT-347P]|uniref:hypothetical protein n=1 Tax=Pseudomonas sp. IT-347P TaxID=3026458 RepID=UPI0039E13C2A